MSFNECQQKITDFLGSYMSQIHLSNKSALGNHAKTSEEVYCGLLNILHPSSNYQKPESINEKGVDLFDPIEKIAIQIKPKLSKSEIIECVKKFVDSKWCKNKKYDFAILLTTSYCTVPEQEFNIDGYAYFNTDQFYLDNNRLLNRLTINNCQEILNYLEKALEPTSSKNHLGDSITKNYGSVINISNTGDMHFNNPLIDHASDQRQVTIHTEKQFPLALHSYHQGFYSEAGKKFRQLLEDNEDIEIKHDSCFYYILSKLSKTNIYKFSKVETDKIYEYLSYLENTKYKNIANLLWLIVYFENIATNVPSTSMEYQMAEKHQRLNYILPNEYQKLIEHIDVYTNNSKKLLSLLSYGMN